MRGREAAVLRRRQEQEQDKAATKRHFRRTGLPTRVLIDKVGSKWWTAPGDVDQQVAHVANALAARRIVLESAQARARDHRASHLGRSSMSVHPGKSASSLSPATSRTRYDLLPLRRLPPMVVDPLRGSTTIGGRRSRGRRSSRRPGTRSQQWLRRSSSAGVVPVLRHPTRRPKERRHSLSET